MSTGSAALKDFIARLEELRSLNEDVAKAAEKGVLEAARASVKAAETPSGEPWAPLKEGGRALKGAAVALTSRVKGNRIDVKVDEPYGYHNHGAGGSSTTKEAVRSRKRTAARQAKTGIKSKFHAPRRQILPVAGEPIPDAMNEAIADAAKRVFEKATGG